MFLVAMLVCHHAAAAGSRHKVCQFCGVPWVALTPRNVSAVQVRDPSFDMVTFLRRLRADVPVIVRAYLLGQTDVLAEHCAPQMVEQLSAIIRAQHTQVG